MTTYARFCAPLERNWLNISRGDKNVSNGSYGGKRRKHIRFFLNFTIFEIMQEKGAKVPTLLRYSYLVHIPT
jgi:hypothetical protein